MKYHYNEYEKAKDNHFYFSYHTNHAYDEMFNELSLKPRSELPHVLAYLKDFSKFELRDICSKEYFESTNSKLNKKGFELAKLCDVVDRLNLYYLHGKLETAIKKHPVIIREYFPILSRYFGTDFKNNQLKSACFATVINQNFEQYKNEMELIYSVKNNDSYEFVDNTDNLFGNLLWIRERVNIELWDKVYNNVSPFNLFSAKHHRAGAPIIDNIFSDRDSIVEFISKCNTDDISLNLFNMNLILDEIDLDLRNEFKNIFISFVNDDANHIKIGLLNLMVNTFDILKFDKDESKALIKGLKLEGKELIFSFLNRFVDIINTKYYPINSYKASTDSKLIKIKTILKAIFITAGQNPPTIKQNSIITIPKQTIFQNSSIINNNLKNIIHGGFEIASSNQIEDFVRNTFKLALDVLVNLDNNIHKLVKNIKSDNSFSPLIQLTFLSMNKTNDIDYIMDIVYKNKDCIHFNNEVLKDIDMIYLKSIEQNDYLIPILKIIEESQQKLIHQLEECSTTFSHNSL